MLYPFRPIVRPVRIKPLFFVTLFVETIYSSPRRCFTVSMIFDAKFLVSIFSSSLPSFEIVFGFKNQMVGLF